MTITLSKYFTPTSNSLTTPTNFIPVKQRSRMFSLT